MLNSKIPMQTQLNSMEIHPTCSELDGHCPIEMMLISQIRPLMFIFAKLKGTQHRFKGCVLVLADLKNVPAILLRSCD